MAETETKRRSTGQIEPLRHERVNTCAECGECPKGTLCDSIRQPLRAYSGIRPTSDGFDCALPISIDSHSVCSYACLYCFSDNLISHRETRQRPVGQTRLSALERIFAGEGGKHGAIIRKALRYDKKRNGYPCAVQLGAICEPLDNIERNQGWFLKFADIAHKYNQPIRVSTKGKLIAEPEYLRKVGEHPELWWFAFSIITTDDELLERIDRQAPNATERLKAMKALSDIGISTSLRLRPIMAGITDSTPKHPKAYAELIERAAEAGAKAISYEVGFVPGAMTEDLRRRWATIEDLAGVPYRSLYRSFGRIQACTRPSYLWTENIMHAIYEKAKECGLTVGVSDPAWKQLTESGCCCGILPDDPVFGNWEPENATNRLLESKLTGCEIRATDIIPPWAYDHQLQGIVARDAGPLTVYDGRHKSWADYLWETWNFIEKQRSPLNYFQGAIVPIRKEPSTYREGAIEIIYKYKGLERQHPDKLPYWKV